MGTSVDIEQLSPAERLLLIERLWDSLDHPQDVEITEAQRRELNRRDHQFDKGVMKTHSEDAVFEALHRRARR